MPMTNGSLHRDIGARVSLGISQLWFVAVSRFVRLPAMAQVALLYAVSRVWGWFVFSRVGLHQTVSPWKNSAMTYLEYVNIWDADWYSSIAATGYPSQLPLDATGHVAQNEWAFYPLYPLTAGTLTWLTGLDYALVAPTLSLICGLGASWFIYRLCMVSLGNGQSAAEHSNLDTQHSTALWASAAVNFSAVAPILQTGYAEAMGLLFLAWALYLLVEGRYRLMLIPALCAALARPIGLPLGAAVGLWWLMAFLHRLRSGQRVWPTLRETATQLVCALAVCAFALIHPAYAWAVTGRIDAYTATEAAWRAGGEDVLPFLPWLTQSQLYLGSILGPLILLVLIAGFTLCLIAPSTRKVLHPALLLWCACYAVYMLAFFNPQSSTFRLLLPLFPLLLPVVALSASRAYRWLLMCAGATLQFGWVGWLWHWKQLPGGGDYPP